MRHLRYLGYIVRHKWFVLVAGLQTGAPIWRLLVHDWSKFLPSEWVPYAEMFYGHPIVEHNRGAGECDLLRAERQAAFDRAWLLHQHRNPHHWQYWALKEDGGEVKALRMPDPLVREMVADWMGAGRAITGRWEVRDWYSRNKHLMQLHPKSRALVETLL